MLRLPPLLVATLALAGCSDRAPAAGAGEAAPAPVTAAGPLAIGMNLAALSGSAAHPVLNRAHLTDRLYVTDGGYRYADVKPEWIGPDGWPTVQPPGARFGIHIPVENGKKYVVTYTGDGNFSFLYSNATSTKAGRILIQATANDTLIEWSTPPGKRLVRDVRVARVDQEAALAAGQVVSPDFVDVIARHFSPLRMMDWGCTNGSQLARWADRPKPADPQWKCASVEFMVAAANAASSDLWITVPVRADDDYVRQMATLVKGTLAPGRKLYLELSNEVWNDSFEQAHYARDQGTARFGAGTNMPGQVWYGYRAAQVMALAKPILGDRLVGVLATADWHSGELDDAIADGVARARLGSVASLFRVYAFAPYFGDALGGASGDEADHAVTLGWAKGGSEGLDRAFAYLEHGTGLKSNTSLDEVARGFPRHAAWARAHGLATVTYEGGLSVYNFNAPEGERGPRVDFLNRLITDPRMGTLYTRLLHDFHAAGGTLFANYADVGGPSIWGAWGMIPDLTSTSPRYQALRAASGR